MTKRLLLLANSRKLSGRCLAGKEILDRLPAGWIRPVSAREHEEVSENERQYCDGSDPRVLDILSVELLEPRPKSYQSENWLLDPGVYWEKVGRAEWGSLERFVDVRDELWIDGQSTYNGCNDHVRLVEAETLSSSLRLIRVESLQLHVFAPGERFNNPKRRVQGRFTHAHQQYWLWVTDPVFERRYLGMDNGTYDIGECYITISLGEPHEGAVYKLIAAIIERPGGIIRP